VKTVTLIGNASLPHFYEEKANRNPFGLSTFDHFLQTFTSLNHLILYDVSVLWPLNAQQHHFKASLQSIEHITFEGIIRLGPIRAVLRLLPNLRSLKFEACQPSFTNGNFLQYSNLATSSVFDPESLNGEGPRAQSPKYPKRLIVKVVNLLTEEEFPNGQGLPCRFTLQRLEFSGLTITDSDIQSLLKLTKTHEERQKEYRGTATPYSKLLTLKACFYTAINDDGGAEDATDLGHNFSRVRVRDAESMGYKEAEELFKRLPEQFKNRAEDDEEDGEDGETDSEDEDED
jgi:hypothetical protein